MAKTMMFFPETVEEFMEQNKIVDTEQIYTNGAELVPIFRMKQWFDHIEGIPSAERRGRWVDEVYTAGVLKVYGHKCSVCGAITPVSVARYRYCPNCGTRMEAE